MANKHLAITVALLTLSACSLAPDFILPETKVPESYKEKPGTVDAYDPKLWKQATPMATADKGQWWRVFGDERLNQIEALAMKNSPTLQAAAARVEQARGQLQANSSSFFPKIDIGANAVRTQASPASLAAFGTPAPGRPDPYTLYNVGASASYEADIFGRVREGERAFLFEVEGAESLHANVMLTLQADVAQHYFSLRALDAERKLLREAISTRREAARIMKKRFDEGAVGEQDYTRTAAELASTEAELLALRNQRASLEHGLAVLVGEMPSGFRFIAAPLDALPPQVPAGIPSELLERRPDIAQAQSAMAAANARIGVARTAFFPRLILSASGALESMTLGDVFDWSGRTWTLGQLAGSALSMTVFDDGRNAGLLKAAEGSYQESLANYRGQVLAAFREVEDNLSAQALEAAQMQKLDEAAAAASRTTAIAQRRYDEGDVAYFEVVDAQRVSLAMQRAAVQVRGQRFTTAVALIRALGGSWQH